MNLTHTEQSGLTLHHIRSFNPFFGVGRWVDFWQHKDNEMQQVGPCYPTKAEALADTADYAERAGWLMGG
jgi:hypothetical protein